MAKLLSIVRTVRTIEQARQWLVDAQLAYFTGADDTVDTMIVDTAEYLDNWISQREGNPVYSTRTAAQCVELMEDDKRDSDIARAYAVRAMMIGEPHDIVESLEREACHAYNMTNRFMVAQRYTGLR